jgi:hypothetical protein
VLGLHIGQRASQPGQHDRLGPGVGQTVSPAVGTLGRLSGILLAATRQFLLGQQSRHFIPDLAGQLLQVDQGARRR